MSNCAIKWKLACISVAVAFHFIKTQLRIYIWLQGKARSFARPQYLVVLLVSAVCIYVLASPVSPKLAPWLANLRVLTEDDVTLQQSVGIYDDTEAEPERQGYLSTIHPSHALLTAQLTSVRHVFYNRVPKCGSRTTHDILKTLSKRNGFHLKFSNIYHNPTISRSKQVRSEKNYIFSLYCLIVKKYLTL